MKSSFCLIMFRLQQCCTLEPCSLSFLRCLVVWVHISCVADLLTLFLALLDDASWIDQPKKGATYLCRGESNGFLQHLWGHLVSLHTGAFANTTVFRAPGDSEDPCANTALKAAFFSLTASLNTEIHQQVNRLPLWQSPTGFWPRLFPKKFHTDVPNKPPLLVWVTCLGPSDLLPMHQIQSKCRSVYSSQTVCQKKKWLQVRRHLCLWTLALAALVP